MNQSPTPDISQAEMELLQALRTAPVLVERVTALLKNYTAETDSGMDAHQAELHAVEFTRQLGKHLLQHWSQQTQNEQIRQCDHNENLIKHGKKKHTGTAPLDASKSTNKSTKTKPPARPTNPSSTSPNSKPAAAPNSSNDES